MATGRLDIDECGDGVTHFERVLNHMRLKGMTLADMGSWYEMQQEMGLELQLVETGLPQE